MLLNDNGYVYFLGWYVQEPQDHNDKINKDIIKNMSLLNINLIKMSYMYINIHVKKVANAEKENST